MENKYYTGVGSRNISKEIEKLMILIGYKLAKAGYILRSGGADGSDTAFETGADLVENSKMEIFLPYKNFNNNKSELYNTQWEAYALAQRYHPIWDNLPDYAKKFHARNVHQVLGENVKTPKISKFLICYTKDGVEYGRTSKDTGGTGTAIRIAQDYGVKIYNLKNLNTLFTVDDLLDEVTKL
jgi:hypothetical protein